MKFEKKLIIMTGKDCKGTVSLERNAYGTFATVNTYNAPDLRGGEYSFGIKTAEGTNTRAVGSLGRIMTRYKLPEVSLEECHCFLYVANTSAVVMYGTTAEKRLWEGNLLDGIRSDSIEKEQTSAYISEKKEDYALPSYSAREKKVEKMFWDILPPAGGYADSAIAEVNYYPSNLRVESAAKNETNNLRTDGGIQSSNILRTDAQASTAAKSLYTAFNEAAATVNTQSSAANINTQTSTSAVNTQSISAATVNTQSASAAVNSYYGNTPSEMERRYLFRYRNHERQTSNGEETAKIQETSVIDEQSLKIQESEEKPKSHVAEIQSEKKQTEEKDREEKIAKPSAASSFTVEQAVRDKRTQARFYEQAAKQIDELFSKNQRHERLEQLMPGTKWVRVEYNAGGKYYVVGLIGQKPDYICYGVPGVYSPKAPVELEGYCAFLPIEDSEPKGKGFWLMYQDAVTGDSVPKP